MSHTAKRIASSALLFIVCATSLSRPPKQLSDGKYPQLNHEDRCLVDEQIAEGEMTMLEGPPVEPDFTMNLRAYFAEPENLKVLQDNARKYPHKNFALPPYLGCN